MPRSIRYLIIPFLILRATNLAAIDEDRVLATKGRILDKPETTPAPITIQAPLSVPTGFTDRLFNKLATIIEKKTRMYSADLEYHKCKIKVIRDSYWWQRNKHYNQCLDAYEKEIEKITTN